MTGRQPTMGATRLSAHGKLLVLVALVAVLAIIAIGALAWGVLRETRSFDNETRRHQVDAGKEVARVLHDSLQRWKNALASARTDLNAVPPDGTLLVVFDSRGVQRTSGQRLPYVPVVSPRPEAQADIFADADRLEVADPEHAAALYRGLAHSADPQVRAGALTRLAALLTTSHPRDALTAYNELLTLGDTLVAGHPAELVARRQRMKLLRDLGDIDAATREANLLAQALSDGRFLIDRATFEVYPGDRDAPPPLQQIADSPDAEHFSTLWPRLTQVTTSEPSGADSFGATVIVWDSLNQGETAALVGPLDRLIERDRPTLRSTPFALQDRRGDWVLGAPITDDEITVPPDPALPWTIHVGPVNTTPTKAALVSSRRVLVSTSGLIVVVLGAAGYLAFRAVRSELDVARRQSEFVAAVSHEFRTPLAALCHLSEMLESGDTPPERFPTYFAALARESRRLHLMVEDLLNFKRLEAGHQTFDVTAVDISEIVSDVARQCQEQIPSAERRLQIVPSDAPATPHQVRVDPAAIGIALRNLLDNALKYSPADSNVTVSTMQEGTFVGVSVRDYGGGIPPDERREVFRKFVRGSAARALNVKGTGIGLAMARQIVEAHGGTLVLDSVIGAGASFTMRLPSVTSHS